ncbi:MAG: archaellin/type IV pilin N-terminal domain-containing protein [Candidatus Aenigmarchaeota archaeon]|nr:hypothetical protein [Candidatus Aenigmarchaeota archaeon]MDW8149171.1 archaellin/type IV pilin N-terminal domain-containing protein [Candidatus Aenigmarchaeota archaeon]
MKGVSEVVAMVMMLVITLALAGTAYVFISGAFTRQTQGVEVVDSYCVGGNVTIQYRNVGTATLANVMINRITPTPPQNPINITNNIAPGTSVTVTDSGCGAGNLCTYRIIPNIGRAIPLSVQCT